MLLVLQVTITRPYLCANHLAAPYTGPAASAAAAPSTAPAPQSSTGDAGEGYGAGTLLHDLQPVLHLVLLLLPEVLFKSVLDLHHLLPFFVPFLVFA